MTNRFMVSVAAVALIAGVGFANAQGTGPNREQPSAGSAQQRQGAPSSERGNSAAPASPSSGMKATQSEENKSPSPGMKASQAEEKPPGAPQNPRAQDKSKAPGPKQ